MSSFYHLYFRGFELILSVLIISAGIALWQRRKDGYQLFCIASLVFGATSLCHNLIWLVGSIVAKSSDPTDLLRQVDIWGSSKQIIGYCHQIAALFFFVALLRHALQLKRKSDRIKELETIIEEQQGRH